MLDPLKNTFLASLGLAAFAQEKLQQAIKELIDRGEMTKEQGKKLVELFMTRGEGESSDLSSRFARELGRVLERTPLVSRHEFDQLAERVRVLEGGSPPESEGTRAGDAPRPPDPASAPDEVSPS